MTAPTTTRRTRRTPTRRPSTRRRRLPNLGWWWTAIALTVIAVARTWPWQTAAATVLLAATLIARAIRPRRLARIWQGLAWISARRRILPRPGHGTRTLSTFLNLTPYGFEQAITELALEDPRVHTAHRVGGANDRGADVLVHLRDGRRILIQCKHHQPGNNVGSPVIQTTNGVYRDIHHCHAAVIVTTAGFTPAAYDTNTRLPHPIRLIDGPALTTWANGGQPPWT
jgi:restriction system protein